MNIILEMNLNNILKLIFYILISFNAFSQKYPSISVINSDTVMIFNIDQAKKIALIIEDKKKLYKLNVINENELLKKDSIITMQYNQIVNCNKILTKYNTIIVEKEKSKKLLDMQCDLYSKEIKRLSRQKWIAIISGVFSVATISYFYVIK